MRLRPLYPYGLLLGLGLLGACGQSQPPTAAAPPAATAPAPPDTLPAAPEHPAALPGAGPVSFPARPVPIINTIGAVTLRRQAAEDDFHLEELTPRLQGMFENDAHPRLFYRRHPRDTTWLELDPGFLEGGMVAPFFLVQQANLDGRGQPEVLLQLVSEQRGSGSWHTVEYSSCYLLDLTPPRPRLLLRASTAEVQVALQGDSIPADEFNIGYERAIDLRGRNVRIGAADTLGRVRKVFDHFPLTPLRAGRYRYQGGQLRRVVP